ncbi:MAG: hypothetical protein V7696_12555 [Halioglobus sp.]
MTPRRVNLRIACLAPVKVQPDPLGQLVQPGPRVQPEPLVQPGLALSDQQAQRARLALRAQEAQGQLDRPARPEPMAILYSAAPVYLPIVWA